MKKLIYFTALFVSIGFYGSYAQGLNLGLKGGANFSNFNGSSPDFNSRNISNYHIGTFLEFGLTESISFQPELMYSTVGANVTLSGASEDFKNELGYISIPLLARFYIIPRKLSIDFGPQVSFLLNESENVNFSKSNTFDFALSGGVTYHILGPLFIQGRYNVGLTDVKPDADVTNRVLQLSAGIRF